MVNSHLANSFLFFQMCVCQTPGYCSLILFFLQKYFSPPTRQYFQDRPGKYSRKEVSELYSERLLVCLQTTSMAQRNNKLSEVSLLRISSVKMKSPGGEELTQQKELKFHPNSGMQFHISGELHLHYRNGENGIKLLQCFRLQFL